MLGSVTWEVWHQDWSAYAIEYKEDTIVLDPWLHGFTDLDHPKIQSKVDESKILVGSIMVLIPHFLFLFECYC